MNNQEFMMSGFVCKSSQRTVSHEIDFAPCLQPGEEVVGDAGWLIHHAQTDVSSLKIQEQVVRGNVSQATFAGGVAGDVYLVTAQVDTDHGRTLKHGFVLAVSRDADQAATPIKE